MHSANMVYAWEEGDTTITTYHIWPHKSIIKGPTWVYDPDDDPSQRYGQIIPESGWVVCTFEKFPSHFKALLLLLNIPLK